MTTRTKVGRLGIKLRRAQKNEAEIGEQAHAAFVEWRRLCADHAEAIVAVEHIERELEIERRIRDYVDGKP